MLADATAMATRGGGQAIPQQAPVKAAPERDSRPNARPERRLYDHCDDYIALLYYIVVVQ